MSVAGPIRSILQQQDRALYQVKKQIKEQGSKAVTQVKEKLPTESEIKNKFKEISKLINNKTFLFRK